MEQSPDEIRATYAVLLIADFTSIIGCIIVLVGFWRLKLLRNHVTKVISCFCLTSICKDVPSTLLTLTQAAVYNRGFPCYFYSIVITYGSLSCWLWTLCLAISIFRLIVKREPEPQRYEKWYYLASWGLPIISTIIMLAKNTVDYVGNWCWIKPEYVVYRFMLFYVPFFIIFGTSAILVGITCHYTYQVIHNGVSDNKDRHVKYQFKLVNYIIVFLICWVFAVVNRIVNGLGYYPFATNLLHTYLSVSHGFFASMVFVYNNPLMWRYFGAKVIRCFTLFGFCTETAKRLEKNKNNNNPSPYSSSRGGSNKTGTSNHNGATIDSTPGYDSSYELDSSSIPYEYSIQSGNIPNNSENQNNIQNESINNNVNNNNSNEHSQNENIGSSNI
uniref:cAMP receptor 1 n=1 Tax=Raperostelium minutum TaxID=35219 RepID=Q6R2K8_9MYCE|nr:cAMP receptor 1 [Raperostelium minutum]